MKHKKIFKGPSSDRAVGQCKAQCKSAIDHIANCSAYIGPCNASSLGLHEASASLMSFTKALVPLTDAVKAITPCYGRAKQDVIHIEIQV